MHVTHQERAPPTTALLEFAPRRLQPCFFTKVIEAAGQTRERSATVRTARKLSDQPIARIMDAHQFARLRTQSETIDRRTDIVAGCLHGTVSRRADRRDNAARASPVDRELRAFRFGASLARDDHLPDQDRTRE